MLHHLNAAPVAPSRVVIIGAGGFVGAAVANRVEQSGVPVLRLTRAEVDLLAPGAAERLVGHLRDGDSVVAAAAIAPCKTVAMLKDNAVLTLALVTALSRVALAHVVNIGSDAVFIDQDHPLTEDSPKAPDSLHGVMHLAREIAFRGAVTAPLAILRPTLIYGAGDPHNGYGPNQFRRKANRGEDVALFGEGEERRDHIAVDDVAEIVFRVLTHRSTGDLNVASGVVTSFRAVATLAVGLAGAGRVVGTPRTGPMPHDGYRAFDIAAIGKAFPGFAPMPLAQGMAQAQAAEFP